MLMIFSHAVFHAAFGYAMIFFAAMLAAVYHYCFDMLLPLVDCRHTPRHAAARTLPLPLYAVAAAIFAADYYAIRHYVYAIVCHLIRYFDMLAAATPCFFRATLRDIRYRAPYVFCHMLCAL